MTGFKLGSRHHHNGGDVFNIKPWIAHKNLGEYAEFLMKQHIHPYFRSGSREVHLVFDDPERQGQRPKFFERQHRNKANPVPDSHHCTDFSPDMVIPLKWRGIAGNAKGTLFVSFPPIFLTNMKTVATALKPKICHRRRLQRSIARQRNVCPIKHPPQSDNTLLCNAEEADTRVWLHTLNSPGLRKLILSPDTDV